MADISLILVSHNKPVLVREAVESVLGQTCRNWEAVLIDSGVLYNQGYFSWLDDSRFTVIPSGEDREMARKKNMASWCFNEILNSGRLSGELILYLCDDDLYYPEAFKTFWDFYVAQDRKPQAMYASQDIGVINPDGRTIVIGRRRARRMAGRACRGAKLDCRVDYLQFCHTAAVLDEYRRAYGTDRFHSENKEDADHADGIFLEKIGALTPVYPIDQVLSVNRRSPDSANLAYSASAFGRWLNLIKAKGKGLRRRMGFR